MRRAIMPALYCQQHCDFAGFSSMQIERGVFAQKQRRRILRETCILYCYWLLHHENTMLTSHEASILVEAPILYTLGSLLPRTHRLWSNTLDGSGRECAV